MEARKPRTRMDPKVRFSFFKTRNFDPDAFFCCNLLQKVRTTARKDNSRWSRRKTRPSVLVTSLRAITARGTTVVGRTEVAAVIIPEAECIAPDILTVVDAGTKTTGTKKKPTTAVTTKPDFSKKLLFSFLICILYLRCYPS